MTIADFMFSNIVITRIDIMLRINNGERRLQ